MLLIVIPQSYDGRSEGYWKSVGDALEANHYLRSLHVQPHILTFEKSHELFMMMKELHSNERLTELTIVTNDLRGM